MTTHSEKEAMDRALDLRDVRMDYAQSQVPGRSFVITHEMVRNLKPCSEARIFERLFPDGMEVTPANLRRSTRFGVRVEWVTERLPASMQEQLREYLKPAVDERAVARAMIDQTYAVRAAECLAGFVCDNWDDVQQFFALGAPMANGVELPGPVPDVPAVPAGGEVDQYRWVPAALRQAVVERAVEARRASE